VSHLLDASGCLSGKTYGIKIDANLPIIVSGRSRPLTSLEEILLYAISLDLRLLESLIDPEQSLLERADPELRREVESLLSQPDSGEHRPAIENLPEVLEDSVTLGICEHSKHNLTTKVFIARSNRAGIVSLGKGAEIQLRYVSGQRCRYLEVSVQEHTASPRKAIVRDTRINT
jgi:hypothetical protein